MSINLVTIKETAIAEIVAATGSEQLIDKATRRNFVGLYDEETNWYIPLRANLGKKKPQGAVFDTPFRTTNPHFKRPGLDFQKAIYLEKDGVLSIRNTLPKEQSEFLDTHQFEIKRAFEQYIFKVANHEMSDNQYFMSTPSLFPEGIEKIKQEVIEKEKNMNRFETYKDALNAAYPDKVQEDYVIPNFERLHFLEKIKSKKFEEIFSEAQSLPHFKALTQQTYTTVLENITNSQNKSLLDELSGLEQFNLADNVKKWNLKGGAPAVLDSYWNNLSDNQKIEFTQFVKWANEEKINGYYEYDYDTGQIDELPPFENEAEEKYLKLEIPEERTEQYRELWSRVNETSRDPEFRLDNTSKIDNKLEQLSINEELIEDVDVESLNIIKNETLHNGGEEKKIAIEIGESSEKQEYIDLIKEAIEDGELSETTNLEEAIYMIDGLKISGEFDYGVRGLDHNALIFDEQKWADVLQWGTVIVPETTSYISDNIIPELDELGYQAVPLLENHKYQIDEKDLVQIDQIPNEIQVENIKTSISSKLSEIQTLNSLEDVAKISGEIDTLEGQLEEVSAQSIEGSEPSDQPLSLQELIAQKDLKGIEEHIKSGIGEYLDSETFKNYLDFARQFRQYSYRNKILIKGQNPKASLVAGYRAWQEKGRQVQRGQKALKIFVPNLAAKKDKDGNYSRDKEGNIIKEVKGFYLASVYDVSQTEGEPIPKPIYELEENINNPRKFDWYIKAITELSPVPIQFSEIEGTAKGFFVPAEKQITIRPGMSQSQTIKTMLHEVTHSILHDNDVPVFGSSEYARQEIEAESVAYMVANSLGIETQDYSFGYLASWTDLGLSLENLEKSLDLICNQAQKMMGELDNILKQTPIEEQTQEVKPEQKQSNPRPKSSIKMHM